MAACAGFCAAVAQINNQVTPAPCGAGSDDVVVCHTRSLHANFQMQTMLSLTQRMVDWNCYDVDVFSTWDVPAYIPHFYPVLSSSRTRAQLLERKHAPPRFGFGAGRTPLLIIHQLLHGRPARFCGCSKFGRSHQVTQQLRAQATPVPQTFTGTATCSEQPSATPADSHSYLPLHASPGAYVSLKLLVLVCEIVS